ncbi:MAG: imidazole glycerol phosphate synthase subunit HisH [Sphingomonadaceae bacterium]|uniref:imidazole glycerol phosphate synthase subunit HisH n=1 Tax=Thermaurantiacus sp. TaxID=2820283 RepID=UPI00298F3ACD|nr:imidazole glycerol phosphate synthase subunit HisH [Thermaurantiacus sp.]MCS6986569.1 imidazole glycerol phosphate synthase subunit HisH [Sphingomonadaceae bacterium]MDW8414170.1 imidazole glycerol phosphate synthase subunit HisH [Thermaurantiacus sp.]
MSVVVVDYGAGNLRSVAKALQAAGAAAVEVTALPDVVARAERIVLPGVGAFGACMRALRAVAGLEEALCDAVRGRGVPFLGICVGMQILAEEGQEFGVHGGLGWIPGTVEPLAPRDPGLPVPQMGWNEVRSDDPARVPPGWAYFVHGFALAPRVAQDAVAFTDYGGPVVAAVARDNLLGVQFHPEKSQAYGLELLSRFLTWRP